MPSQPANTCSPTLSHRLLAATVAALVLLLSVLAVSPQLHADLHACGHDHGHSHHHEVPVSDSDSDPGCVVTLFGQGITAGPAPVSLATPAAALVAPIFFRPSEVAVSPPCYLHQPGRGPPLG